jgi:hypothetical protein
MNMKLRRFNEEIDRKELDPYNEENWSEKNIPVDYSDIKGVCAHCGSDELDWGDNRMDGDFMTYKYTCCNCDKEGQEVYHMTFVINEQK